jgi:hypothetical protein
VSISELRDLADEPAVLWWFLAAGLTISVAMVCIYYALDLRQGFGRDPDRQHRPVLLIDLGRDVLTRRNGADLW